MKVVILGSWPAMMYKYHAPLIRDLIESGAEVHLVAPDMVEDPLYAPQLSALGAFLHSVKLRRNGMNPIADLGAIIAIYRLLRALRPDAILSYTVKPVVYGTLAARLVGVKRKVALIVGLGYAFTGEAKGKRAVVRQISVNLYKIALRQADEICFQNRDDAHQFRQLNVVTSRQKVTVVNGCGVDLDVFHPLPLAPGPTNFLFVGRLLGDKGVRELVDAARRIRGQYPETRFTLLGGLDSNPDGIGEKELNDWIAEGVVDWLGYREDVIDVLAACHVFVLPSYREGLPQSTLEAMASARAVISTDAPGCRETVIEGTNGFMVPVGDSVALSEAMGKFLQRPELIGQMGQASRELAESKFDVRLINRTLISALLGDRDAKHDNR